MCFRFKLRLGEFVSTFVYHSASRIIQGTIDSEIGHVVKWTNHENPYLILNDRFLDFKQV